jgi:digeranylgeranylglycerophospholipid reductase
MAGLYCGMKLAAAGWRVCACDRRKHIGIPVRCGEATGNRAELARFVDIDESWIAADIDGIAVHCNDALTFSRTIPDSGIILHRDRFEKYLAREAASYGMELRCGIRVCGLVRSSGSFDGVTLEDGSEIKAGLIIGADGAESNVGQWAGITKPLRPSEAFTSIQYTFESDFCRDEMLHFFVGSQNIPKGYIWVFPKAGNRISAGAGLYGCHHSLPKAKDFLDTFIESHIPGQKPAHCITGCVPLAACPRTLFKDTVVVVGDAARQCNPLTAGGIMNALEAADCLVKNLVDEGAPHAHALSVYSKALAKRPRFEQKAYLLFKEFYLTLSDKQLADIIAAISNMFKGPFDRSRPFRIRPGYVIRILAAFFPRLSRHMHILWQ